MERNLHNPLPATIFPGSVNEHQRQMTQLELCACAIGRSASGRKRPAEILSDRRYVPLEGPGFQLLMHVDITQYSRDDKLIIFLFVTSSLLLD